MIVGPPFSDSRIQSDAEPIVLGLDGVRPSDESIVDGSYAMKRNLVFVTAGAPSGNIAAFLSWVTSDEGQAVVGGEFVPLESRTSEMPPDGRGDATIVIGGSTSLSETAGALAEAYMEKYGFMRIVIQGGGSGAGEKQTASGAFDIGMLSRNMDPGYSGILVPHIVGIDGVAVAANISGVDDLSSEQVAKLFSGEYTNWKQVGGPDLKVLVIVRDEGSGTRECFDGCMKSVSSGWSCKVDAVSCQSTGLVIGNIQSTVGSIGYINIGQAANL